MVIFPGGCARCADIEFWWWVIGSGLSDEAPVCNALAS